MRLNIIPLAVFASFVSVVACALYEEFILSGIFIIVMVLGMIWDELHSISMKLDSIKKY